MHGLVATAKSLVEPVYASFVASSPPDYKDISETILLRTINRHTLFFG